MLLSLCPQSTYPTEISTNFSDFPLISVSTDSQNFNKKSIPHIQHIVAANTSADSPETDQNLPKMPE